MIATDLDVSDPPVRTQTMLVDVLRHQNDLLLCVGVIVEVFDDC